MGVIVQAQGCRNTGEFPDFWESHTSPTEGLCSRHCKWEGPNGTVCVELGQEKSLENAQFPNQGISTE